MTENVLDRIGKWCDAEENLDQQGDPPKVIVAGDSPIELSVDIDTERVLLSHDVINEDPSAIYASEADALLTRRGTMLRGSVTVSQGTAQVHVEQPIYIDGFNRQTFLQAVHEMTAAVDAIAALQLASPQPVGRHGDTSPDPVVEPIVVASPDTTEAHAGTPEAASEATIDLIATPAWLSTHRTPSGGMRVWGQPDPTAEPTTRLDGKAAVRVHEERGAWARVTTEGGVGGWVDGRRLEAAKTTTSAGSTRPLRAGGLEVRPMLLVGGILVAVATFLSWFDTFGSTANGFDVPISFLWDTDATSGLSVGVATLVIGAAIAVAALWPKPVPPPAKRLGKVAGALALAIGVVFIVQVIRAVTDLGGSAADAFTDFLGIAAYMVVVGGVLALIGAKRA